ncbi:MAG: Hpt domain-containing protein [Rhodospirillales bacterium]|nr:Hpt domain-containing protein [Rhodospirillales bacterium]
MAKEEELEIINPPNTLKTKVKKGGPGAINPAMLEKAEQVLAGLSDSYLEWVQQDLKNISSAFEELKAGRGDQKETLDRIFRISHDMKGQGGSFGYNLVTSVGNELCRMIEKFPATITPAHIDAIGVHIDSLKLIVAQKMKGDAGSAGAAMLAGLQKVSAKLTT